MSNRFVILLIIAVSGILPISAQDIGINSSWRFMTADSTADFHDGLPSSAHGVTLPHTWNVEAGLEDYVGRGWYERLLTEVTPDMKGATIRLHFGAVYHDATVWVNGKLAGQHLNAGYTPFSFDITKYLSFAKGSSNRLVVMADNGFSASNLPYKRSFDWAADGGIYRDVHLHVSRKHTIRYVHVTPHVRLTDSTATAHFDIRLFGSSEKSTAKFIVSIRENSTGRTIYSATPSLKIQKDGTYKLDADCHRVKLWHFDNPNLYTFTVDILSNGQLCDSMTDRFGFRTFTIEGDHFCLNGEPVRLPGIEDMPGSNPQYGMAEPHSYMLESVKAMKRLNATISRYHWAQDDYRLQLMDSLGILVQEELSWWQQPGKGLTPELRKVARQQIAELIEAHYNHPCIYGWGMSNEVGGNTNEITALASYTRSLDSTRIVDALCNKIWQTLDKDPSLALDLPTWNEYTGTWHGKDRSRLPEHLSNIGKVLQGRPLFITEHGLCEPAFTGGDARRIDEMLYHINHWKAQPFVCGYIYFCLQDYRTQMGEEGYGKYRIRRHGVCTDSLTPKASYSVLRQLSSPIEVTEVRPANAQRNDDTLAQVYAVNAHNHDVSITLRVASTIPSYTLHGYVLSYTASDGTQRRQSLPALSPGSSYTITITDINAQYHFSILRADGTSVVDY